MAQKHGLGFLSDWPVGDDDRVEPRDSYAEFVTEHPGTTAVIKRQPRAVGLPLSLNETIDGSLLARITDGTFLQRDPQLKAALQQLPRGLH
jgi:hypothetical protein